MVITANGNDTKVPSINGLVSKSQYNSDKTKFWKKRLNMLIKRYLILMDWLKKLSTTLKLPKLRKKVCSITVLVTTTAVPNVKSIYI